MATIILGTVGRVFGGPIGGILGTAVGGFVDRSVFGGGGRDAGRISNLAVQSAAYGEPIPAIIGRIRAAGNLIWTSGIVESTSAGGGKSSGSGTSYSYSASFAVGLSALPIAAVGRIWADGKLIRDAGGSFLSPITMRLHGGSEGQAVDPLVAAAEGLAGAPAYRGLAYAVFEDLPLADYGNRIPNLTFEISSAHDVAAAGLDIGIAITVLGGMVPRTGLAVTGSFPAITGHFAGRAGSLAEALAPLLAICDAGIRLSSGVMTVQGEGGAPFTLPAGDAQAHAPGSTAANDRQQLTGREQLADIVELGFYDTSRDYQPGLQRARRGEGTRLDQRAVACAMSPEAAKAMAATMLAQSHAGKLRATLRLPWRYLPLVAGETLRTSGSDVVWRVREARFEGFVVALDLERRALSAGIVQPSDGGRSLAPDESPVGMTELRVFELPGLAGVAPETPQLLVTAAGASPGWRRCAIEISDDGGASYHLAGIIEAGAVFGTTVSALPSGTVAGWDAFSQVEISLLNERMWLESRPDLAVLNGANLALIGDELVHFGEAEALAPGRFRLRRLLRGRRGTEAMVGTHGIGERFALLGPAGLLKLDLPLEALGRGYRLRAAGVADAAAPALELGIAGRVLRPLAPAQLRLAMEGDALVARWVRRSRSGFAWLDFADAPMDEVSEAYRVEVRMGGQLVRSVMLGAPLFSYSAAERAADGVGGLVTLSVAQLSAAVGPGDAANAQWQF